MIDVTEELQAAAPRPQVELDLAAIGQRARRRSRRQRVLTTTAVLLVVLVAAAGVVSVGRQDPTPAAVDAGAPPDSWSGLAPGVTRPSPTANEARPVPPWPFKVVTYDGVAFDVPVEWPMIDLTAESTPRERGNPGACPGAALFTRPMVLTGRSKADPACLEPGSGLLAQDGLWISAPLDSDLLALTAPERRTLNGLAIEVRRTTEGAPALVATIETPRGAAIRAVIGLGVAYSTTSEVVYASIRPVRPAPAERSTLHGRLRLRGGALEPGADPASPGLAGTVDARPLDTVGPTFSASTDDSGQFSIELPVGTYELTGRSRSLGGDASCPALSAVIVAPVDTAAVDVDCVVK